MTNIFEMNGKFYATDAESIEVLRSIIPAAKQSNDTSAVAAFMYGGLISGRIVQVEGAAQ